jgi:hypothetical protein
VTRRQRRNHTAAFKAKVALACLRGTAIVVFMKSSFNRRRSLSLHYEDDSVHQNGTVGQTKMRSRAGAADAIVFNLWQKPVRPSNP